VPQQWKVMQTLLLQELNGLAGILQQLLPSLLDHVSLTLKSANLAAFCTFPANGTAQ
jgi:hypothetical protein